MFERRLLRWVFAGMAVLTAQVAVYTWTENSSATDWDWIYRLGLPIAVASLAWGAYRPRIIGVTRLFIPISVLAIVRVIDFQQDWYLTPGPVEPVNLPTRVLLGSYGWGMIVLSTLLVLVFERIATRLLDQLNRRESPLSVSNNPVS